MFSPPPGWRRTCNMNVTEVQSGESTIEVKSFEVSVIATDIIIEEDAE